MTKKVVHLLHSTVPPDLILRINSTSPETSKVTATSGLQTGVLIVAIAAAAAGAVSAYKGATDPQSSKAVY